MIMTRLASITSFGDAARSARLLPAALGLNLTSAGIPCIYYGTEQGFNGADPRTDDNSYSDVFLRECMFGGDFGSFRSSGKHFFNEKNEIYRFVQKVIRLRREHLELSRGRQYLRPVSESGRDGEFYYPQPVNGELHWVIAWSRIFAGSESLCAINTDTERELTLWIVVDSAIHAAGSTMNCLFSTDALQLGRSVSVMPIEGSAVQITVPAAGFVVYGQG